MLDRAIQIAVRMHAGKSNKTGEPAVFHSLRVMMSLESEIERVCGVLAGSAGRPGCTLDDLAKEGFGEDVLSALRCLTKRLARPMTPGLQGFLKTRRHAASVWRF